MRTLFISDVHLAPERPHITQQFHEFLNGVAIGVDALYILGDLFEYWIGDDAADDALDDGVAQALKRLAGRGVPVSIMHGNRDLLLGHSFAERCGARIIPDPAVIDLYGKRTLLLHGDTLCTEDREYQQFRAYVHDPANQSKFLSLSPGERREKMHGWMAASRRRKDAKTDDIMDVSPSAVEHALRENGYPRMIHGHTHRPAHHVHEVDGHVCDRWVLNDWYERGGYLECDSSGAVTVHRAPWTND